MALLTSPPKSDGPDGMQRVPGRGEAGMALPAVLAILAALIAFAALLMQRGRHVSFPFVKARDGLQAQYAAESGVAWALYLERYGKSLDTSASGAAPGSALAKGTADAAAGKDLNPSNGLDFDTTARFRFRTDTGLALPDVAVDRDGPFLEILSRGRAGEESVQVKARFGRALDATAFGAALTWENDMPVQPFSMDKVRGGLRLKTATPGLTSQAWPEGFSVGSYAQAYVAEAFRRAETALQTALAKEGGESGNGYFEARRLPDFEGHAGAYRYPLGQVEITGGAFDTLTLKGPGAIYAHGEIRVRGKVRFVGVTLASEKDLVFEGEVTGSDMRVYARRHIQILGKCRLEMQGLAGGDIHLRDEAATVGASLLAVMAGAGGDARKGDSVQAIRVVQRASAEGFLLAVGAGSRVVMGGEANAIRGVILAEEAWLAGRIEGAVAVRTLRCSEKSPPQCLGQVRIDRTALNPRFLQPLELGSGDPKRLQFQLLSYEVARAVQR